MRKTLRTLFIPILLFLPPVWPWLMRGFPVTDDGNWMVIRLSAFYETLRGGDLPVRFIARLNNGYGYPVSDFLYPLFLYVGTFVHIIGISSFVLVIKILFILSFILSGYFCYLWLRQRVSTLNAVIGSLFFTYFPYHFWDMNHRGSLGEMISFAIVPFILWQIERKSIFFTSIGFLLLLTAHNTQALLFLPLLLVYLYVEKKEFIQNGLISLAFGAGMSAWFIFPALLDQKYTVFNHTPVTNAPVFFTSLPFMIGLTALSIVFGGFTYKKGYKKITLWIFLLFITLICTSQLSQVAWTPQLLLKYVQFPIRFFGPIMLLGTIILVDVLPRIARVLRYIILAMCVAMAIFFSVFGFSQSLQQFPEGFYTTNEDTTTVQGEYMPMWVTNPLAHNAYPDISLSISGKEFISHAFKKGNSRTFETSSPRKETVIIHAVYFPGWSAKVDGQKVVILPQAKTGLVTFPIPSGVHQVSLKFQETPQHLFFDILSGISVILCVGYSFLKKKYV